MTLKITYFKDDNHACYDCPFASLPSSGMDEARICNVINRWVHVEEEETGPDGFPLDCPLVIHGSIEVTKGDLQQVERSPVNECVHLGRALESFSAIRWVAANQCRDCEGGGVIGLGGDQRFPCVTCDGIGVEEQ